MRTAFQPSNDAYIYQFLVLVNIIFAKYLKQASLIIERLPGSKAENLTMVIRDFTVGIRKGVDRDAIVRYRDFGDIFAYKVDSFGGANLMDDANIPLLLAIPLFNYSASRNFNNIYQNTRRFVLSEANPYYAKGPVLSAIGGPHLGPGKGWPMAAVVAAITAFKPISGVNDVKRIVKKQLRILLNLTAGTGIMYESINA